MNSSRDSAVQFINKHFELVSKVVGSVYILLERCFKDGCHDY